MNIRKIIAFAFVLFVPILIAGFISCERVQQIVQPTTPQMEGFSGEIAIGAVHPLTGRLGLEHPPVGYGFELAVEEVNNSQLSDVKIRLIVEDSQSTVEGAVAAFNKLIHQDGVSAILGPEASTQAQEVFPIAQQNQVVAMSPTSAASGLSAIGDFIFRTNLTTDVIIPNGVRVTQEKLDYQKVATLFDDTDVFSKISDAELREALTGSGVEILTTEHFQGGDTDFSAQFARIKELNPDVIFVSAVVVDTPKILIQGRQLGIPFEVPFIVNLTLSTDQLETAGDAAEGTITFTSWDAAADTPGNQAFVQNYTAKYGVEPSVWAALSYTAVYVLAEAITEAQSTDSSAIAAALAEIKDFDTILGKFSFNADGDAVYAPVVLIVNNGKFEVFE